MRGIHDYTHAINLGKRVITALHDGNPVILPTETVYGLAVLPQYIDKLYSAKQRPGTVPIAFAYYNVESLLADIETNEYQKMCIKALLPGPFTLLLNDKQGYKIGIRVPDHSVCQTILSMIQGPLLLTSANLHKQKPAVTFVEACKIFPEIIGVDGGQCKYSRPSMIIDLTHTR
jgi:L-threonylcarbamoyladenylate synthase